MENALHISIRGYWLSPEIEQKYLNWTLEAYSSVLTGIPQVLGTDQYRIMKGRPEYPGFITIQHFESLESAVDYYNSQDYRAVDLDRKTTFGDLYKWVWHAQYDLLEGVNQNRESAAPLMHLEGFNLSPESNDKYNNWFNKWGHSTYLPLLLKNAGLTGFAFYRFKVKSLQGSSFHLPDDVAYPQYLSIYEFENLKAFNTFENSLELAAFRGATEVGFANSLTPKWYVQYQLMKSRRK